MKTLGSKLLVLCLFPLLVAVSLLMKQVFQEYERMQMTSVQEQGVMLLADLGAVLHETQKERGATAIFVSSQGKKFQNELRQQRQLTDKVIAAFQKWNPQSKTIQSVYGDASEALKQLRQLRGAVDRLSWTTVESLARYSAMNTQVLMSVEQAASLMQDENSNRLFLSYRHFLNGKEKAGIERAVLSGAFTRDGFTVPEYNHFIRLVAEQSTHFGNFINVATDDQRGLYQGQQKQAVFKEVERLREIAKAKGIGSIGAAAGTPNFGVDGAYWFKTKTKKINALKKVENQLASDLQKDARQLQETALYNTLFAVALAVGVTTIVLIATFYFIRSITQPLAQVVSMAHKVTEGDLTESLCIHREDEIGLLAKAMNQMTVHLKTLIGDVSGSSASLKQGADQLSIISTNTSDDVKVQHDEVQQVAAAMSQMIASVEHVASSAESAQATSQQTQREAQQGQLIVNDASQAIQQLSQEIEHTSSVVNALAQNSNDVSGVLDVIRDIAEQTNLLALNAAIEAARAGEQGRGFAVVADEVRTLAARTQQSTVEIQQMIEALQAGSQQAVTAMKQGQATAREGVEHADKVAQALNNITEAVQTVSQMNEQIALSTSEQLTASSAIDRSISGINASIVKTANGAEESAQMAKALEKTNSDLLQKITQFKCA